MGYERNRFRSVGPGAHILGSVVEYDASRRGDKSAGWRLAVYAVVLLSVLASFLSARGCFHRRTTGDFEIAKRQSKVRPVAVAANPQSGFPGNGAGSASLPVEVKKTTKAARQASSWAENASGRTPRERTLLMRLADAERQGRLELAVDTITQLRAIPSMADLDDKLARRLGDLNIKRLFSGEPVPWISETTVRRGQSVHRIAREHGTTVAAIRQLNGLSATDEPSAGRRLRVLEFPRAAFVVHKQTHYADLSLNGKLFKRYYVSVGKSTKPGAYPITSNPTEGPRSRLSRLDIRLFPADLKELDMFLAPGSSLTVSEM